MLYSIGSACHANTPRQGTGRSGVDSPTNVKVNTPASRFNLHLNSTLDFVAYRFSVPGIVGYSRLSEGFLLDLSSGGLWQDA